ncbi:MAG: DUF89 family protein [Candidatus Helarchaeota archaeon]|nr:DUF89 family protein [Candidatus Helarchaeota archaeon]
MRTHLDCIPCFQRQALQAVRFTTDDEKTQERVLRKVITALQQIDWKQTPPQIARIVHKIVRDETAERDPYLKVKKESNDNALELYPSMKKLVTKSEKPLYTAIQIAIAGNIIDFGAMANFNLKETISKVLKTPFIINDFSKFVQVLSKSQTLTYLGDNTGEIVLYRLLLETILNKYKIKRIQFAVKGAPIINDATIEDAIFVGLNQISGLEFIKIGIGIPGTGLERHDKEFLKVIEESDMVISKGQGNYEALSDQKNIFFLLLAKCPVVAKDLGVKVGDIILKGEFP